MTNCLALLIELHRNDGCGDFIVNNTLMRDIENEGLITIGEAIHYKTNVNRIYLTPKGKERVTDHLFIEKL